MYYMDYIDIEHFTITRVKAQISIVNQDTIKDQTEVTTLIC